MGTGRPLCAGHLVFGIRNLRGKLPSVLGKGVEGLAELALRLLQKTQNELPVSQLLILWWTRPVEDWHLLSAGLGSLFS